MSKLAVPANLDVTPEVRHLLTQMVRRINQLEAQLNTAGTSNAGN